MMKFYHGVAVAALATLTSPAHAQAQFGLEYSVERVDARKLDLAKCMATVKRASGDLGYSPMLSDITPGRLGVFSAGPRGGGSALLVYCIAVDSKTAFVVQGLDYTKANPAAVKRAADYVRHALLKASA